MVSDEWRGYTGQMKIPSALLSLVLVGASCAALAQWQWLDKDGRRVFSDRAPPPDVMEKNILKRPGGVVRSSAAKDTDASSGAAPPQESASASGISPPPGGVDKDLEARKKQAADAEAAKRRAEEDRVVKARIENCARAKQAMATLDSGIRISRANAAGEREVLDDAGRAAERAQVQKTISSDCQ